MAIVDFELLRKRIASAACRAFSQVRAAHPEECFYAFALYTVGDAVFISPSASSEEAYARKRAKYAGREDFTEADLRGNFRWSPFEWEYECDGADFFNSASELINNHGTARYDRREPDGFVNFKAGVFASMVLSLSDLEAEGFFGTGAARKSVIVFCSVADSGCAPWLEADSARRLNPRGALKTFSIERIAYISDEFDEIPPKGDAVYDAYMSRMRRSKGGS